MVCRLRLASAADSRRLHGLVRRAMPLPFPPAYRDLLTSYGLRTAPSLRLSSEVTSPFLAGLFRPTIVLPATYPEKLSPEEFRFGLAHELAHLRRRDLLSMTVPALTRVLFVFHPLARLTYTECVNAREEASDALALRATRASPSAYGRFLLGIFTAQAGNSPHSAGAMGMAAASFAPLKSRLLALRRTEKPARQGVLAATMAFAGLGALPVQFVTRSPNPAGERVVAPLPPPRYTLVDLGTLGGQSSDATGISDGGIVVGGANFDHRNLHGHAFETMSSGDTGISTICDISTRSGLDRGIARAVNRSGNVILEAFSRPGRVTGLLLTPTGLRRLGKLPGFVSARPLGINAAGDIAGVAQAVVPDALGALPMRAIVFHNATPRDIGTLGGRYAAAQAINDAGVVVGKSEMPGTPGQSAATHAFVYDGTVPRDLGVLPGGTDSVADAIDRQGRIVGSSDSAGGFRHAFLWTKGEMIDLGTPADLPFSRAYGINDAGVVGGAAYSENDPANGVRRAVIWLPSADSAGAARPVDLNTALPPGSPWLLETARAINGRGQIVGQNFVKGRRRAFLLNPVVSRDGR